MTREEAIKAIKAWDFLDNDEKEAIETLIPELAESKDERIRKALIDFFQDWHKTKPSRWSIPVPDVIAWLEKQGKEEYALKSSKHEDILKFMQYIEKGAKSYEFNLPNRGYDIYAFAKDILTWLEKQGKQKSADDIQNPTDINIHQGDKNNPYDMSFEEAQNYITKRDFDICCTDVPVYVDDRYILQTIANILRWADDNPKQPDNKVEPKFKVGDFIVNDYCFGKIVEITNDAYLLDTGQGIPFSCEHNVHLWTITDAVDGNVLVYNKTNSPFIFNGKIKDYNTGNPKDIFIGAYCGINGKGEFEINLEEYWTVNNVKPATKEQSELLFSKMHESGYEWDSEKKDLRKIEQKPKRVRIKESTGTLKEMLEVDSFDSELNALLKKYENLPKGEVVECLSFYLEDIQGKPKWTDKDEENFRDIIGAIHRVAYQTTEDEESRIEWIKSLKQRIIK